MSRFTTQLNSQRDCVILFFRLILLGDFSENMWCKKFCYLVSDLFSRLRKIIMSLITKVLTKFSSP